MKTDQKIYVAVGLLAVAAIGVYSTRQSDKKQLQDHSATAASADMPSVAVPKDDIEKITKLEITTPKKDDKEQIKVVLEKKGDSWEVTSPASAKGAKANAANVKSAIDNLKELKIKESIDRTANTYAQYELTDEKAVHVLAYKGGDRAIDAYFGKNGSRGQMARVGGKDGVWIVGGYSSYLFSREVKNWRETSILKFEDANAIQVEVTNKNGVFSFSKNGDKWSNSWTKLDKDGKLEKKPEKEWKKFDEGKVKDLLRAYKALSAEDFADAKADTGLDKADSEGGIVKIKLKDNGGDLTMKIGKVSKGTSRYAVKDGGDGTVYVLSSWAADWATAKHDKFEKDEKKDAKDGKPGGMPPGMPPGMPGMPGMGGDDDGE
jgi:hypothetical protein